MADDFQGSDYIDLEPGSSNVPYRFNITVASSSKKNDGHLPYGSTLHTSTARAHHSGGSTAGTTALISSVSVSSQDVIVTMNYTSELSAGLYHMRLNITASVQGSTATPLRKHLDFDRIYLKDR